MHTPNCSTFSNVSKSFDPCPSTAASDDNNYTNTVHTIINEPQKNKLHRIRRNLQFSTYTDAEEISNSDNNNNDNVNDKTSDNNDNTHQQDRRRRVLKVIKRKPKLLSEDLIDPETKVEPKLAPSIESEPVLATSATPIRRRIAITRKRPVVTISSIKPTPTFTPFSIPLPTQTYFDDDEEEIAPRRHGTRRPVTPEPTKRIKKVVLKSKKRLIQSQQEEVHTLEPSPVPIPTATPIPTPLIYTTETYLLDTITTTTTRKRTYTFVVTRVNDKESVVMSSTSVKDHIGPSTQTVTRTISLTITIPPIQQTKSYYV